MAQTERQAAEARRVFAKTAARAEQRDTGYLLELLERALEDAEDIIAATEALERIRRGEERTYSSDEVRRELGLDD